MAELLFWIGPDKILFGSDYAIWTPKWMVEKFWNFQIPEDIAAERGVQLTDEIKEKILGLNAARLYDIDVAAAKARLASRAGLDRGGVTAMQDREAMTPRAARRLGPARSGQRPRAGRSPDRPRLRRGGLGRRGGRRARLLPAAHLLVQPELRVPDGREHPPRGGRPALGRARQRAARGPHVRRRDERGGQPRAQLRRGAGAASRNTPTSPT